MKQITIQELKRQLSEIVAAAESGERFIIVRHNKPVAELGSTNFVLERTIRAPDA